MRGVGRCAGGGPWLRNQYHHDLDCAAADLSAGVGADCGGVGADVRLWREFIYLAVPTSTAVPLGTVVTWFTGSLANYTVAVIPTTAKGGEPAAVCVSNTTGTTGGITSNTTSIQYAWFQLVGIAQTLKTADIHTLNGRVFISATAGRVMVTSAVGTELIGARFASSNSATISCALVWFDRPNKITAI